MENSERLTYATASGLVIDRWSEAAELTQPIEDLIDQLDSHRGALFTSTFEYPGRYTRWDMGFVDPAIEVRSVGRAMEIEAHNPRGAILLSAINAMVPTLVDSGAIMSYELSDCCTRLMVNHSNQKFHEEDRSRQPSVFSVLRAIIDLFRSSEDAHLGLYGAFGYDLAFQFEPITEHRARSGKQRDLVLFIPDQLVVVDHKREVATRFRYDFSFAGRSTLGQPYVPGDSDAFIARPEVGSASDHKPGEYAGVVEKAKEYFARGDLFEVTPSQVFSEGTHVPPSEMFRRLRRRNPAPYGALMNLGRGEYLVSASPEMYVRVEGRRVETCPIAGTIPRGADVLSDADQIRELLSSVKDESELTMCTDVDRNDKSRVCDPESIRVIGRRQIEMYSRLIHTVDHVEGTLLPQFDGLDAFLAHTWAVTVTGAPKLWAMRFIEEFEKAPRAWYGGAIGALTFNGNINTGLTLRTIHVLDGVAHVRVGATLLMDSDPEAEDAETRTKASAQLDAIRNDDAHAVVAHSPSGAFHGGTGKRILLVDHEDSFVHTLAGYLRRTGALVTTVRVAVGKQLDVSEVAAVNPDMIVLSPGPGRPSDFALSETLTIAIEHKIPVFGVCLGLQGIVEHFGGKLDQLSYPAHGKPSKVLVKGDRVFAGLPEQFSVGRYHSLFADKSSLPDELRVTAETEDGLVMAVEHATLPISAVQFHPESIMTMRDDLGMHLINNLFQ